MKRIFCLCCVLLLCTALLSSCGKKDDSETDEISYRDISLTDDMMAAVKVWENMSAYELSFTSYMSLIVDGDASNPTGKAMNFEVKMIPGENGNLYFGKYTGTNSYLSFDLSFDYYYYDGWEYEIYRDATLEDGSGDQYAKYDTSEEGFLAAFDQFLPAVPTDEEFAQASVTEASTGVITVSVPILSEKTLRAVVGDLASFAEINGVDEEDLSLIEPVVSYALKDGKMLGYVASYSIQLTSPKKGAMSYEFEKSASVLATGEDVERFSLPENLDEFVAYDE